MTSALIRDATMRSPGGRVLAFAEWGDPAGRPVLHFHGIPGSRFERHIDDRIYGRLGIRYITVDRPGYGGSDPAPGRTFTDWASDVAALTSYLGIDTIRLVGVSGGGPFALAAAAALPSLVERVAIVSGVGPADRPGAFRGMDLSERLTYWASPRYPRASAVMTSAFLGGAARASDFFARAASHAGKTAAARATEARVVSEQLREALRQGSTTTVWENALCARPWGFSLNDVRAPVHLWHGARDRICPLHHAEYLEASLPDATLTVRPGGHFLILRAAEEVLRSLIS
jgi:pimeloyl-ACP methyl ester carboxylesterase